MSTSPLSSTAKRQPAQAGEAPASELDLARLLQQGNVDPTILKMLMQGVKPAKTADNDFLRRLVAGMSGTGLFGS